MNLTCRMVRNGDKHINNCFSNVAIFGRGARGQNAKATTISFYVWDSECK